MFVPACGLMSNPGELSLKWEFTPQRPRVVALPVSARGYVNSNTTMKPEM